jgi:fosfomycin resistance protein FosX
MEGEQLPTRTYNHVAFRIADYLLRVRTLGLEVREGRSRVPGEERSIYFYDHDRHA